MTIIAALRAYLATCPALETGALLLVDHVGSTPFQYAIIPAPGTRIVSSFIDGGSIREFPFVFQTSTSTADDLERIENAGFNETFADWLEAQTEAENLPDLGSKKQAMSVEATSWGYLFEQGDSETGIYQIVCKLTYKQQP